MNVYLSARFLSSLIAAIEILNGEIRDGNNITCEKIDGERKGWRKEQREREGEALRNNLFISSSVI